MYQSIFLKFRQSLPECISTEVILEVMTQCIHRLEDDLPFLLEPALHVSYGEPVHHSDLGSEDAINVYSSDPFPITWVFDADTGELLAT